jgi:hypothetical protein
MKEEQSASDFIDVMADLQHYRLCNYYSARGKSNGRTGLCTKTYTLLCEMPVRTKNTLREKKGRDESTSRKPI